MFIYGLCDPRNQELRYVGFTSKSLSERLRGHLKTQSLRFHTHKNFWIKSLLKDGVKPEIFEIEKTNKDNWQFDEQWNIEYFKSLGCRLTNVSEGGRGTLGFSHTEESKNIIGLKSLGRNIGKKPTEFCKEQHLKAMRKLNDEQIADIKLKYSSGLFLYKDLAKQYNVHERTISRILKMELKYLNGGKKIYISNIRRKLSQHSINDIYELYWNKNIKQTVIAKQFSVDSSTVSDIVNQRDNYRYQR